jgi:hypothetical protein
MGSNKIEGIERFLVWSKEVTDDDNMISTLGESLAVSRVGTRWPPAQVTSHMRSRYSRLKVGDSSVKGLGKGLFLKKGSGLIKKGEVIAVYGGTVVDEVNGEYVLEVRRQLDCSSVWIDGQHNNSVCDMLKASYSNEYIWDDDNNNAKFDDSAVLRARYDIDTRKHDVEVFTCYGSEYDWDAVKVLSISAVCEYIRQLALSLYDQHCHQT